jgi:polysaccharide export outer membrane protein
MNAFSKYVVGTAGVLILQLAVAASEQPMTLSLTDETAPGQSALPPDQNAGRQSSEQRYKPVAEVPAKGAATQPGKTGGKGDPTFGGERHPLYRLSKSDTIDINFTFSSDFNQTVTVQPDGFVELKGAGSLFVEGSTLPETQLAVANAYRGILHEPEVTISLKEFDKPYFLASGEVGRPGKYELRGDLTIAEAVAMAGGFTQQALHSQVVVFRRVSRDFAESHVIDLKKMLNSHDLREDLHLQAGDFIFVPQSRISKIRKFVPANALSWYMNPLQF